MQRLTDILSLFKRKQIIKQATPNDVVVLGRHEEPDMLGIASPIPYKSVKLIKVKDLIESQTCDFVNLTNGGSQRKPHYVFKNQTEDPCEVNFRSLSTSGNNISIQTNLNELIFSTDGEPNTGLNVGGGVGVFKDKNGEALRFKTLKASGNITIQEGEETITLDCQSSNELPYTSIDCLLTNGRDNAPTIDILSNNTIHTLSSTYESSGRYGITITPPLPGLNVMIMLHPVFKSTGIGLVNSIDLNGFEVLVKQIANGNPLDNALLRTPLEIRIYPNEK